MDSLQYFPSKRPLYWLAVGTFAVGTESFMIAGLLPGMARDLGVGIGVAGQLGWRMTFGSVAVLSSLAVIGLLLGLPREIGTGLAAASLRLRLATATQPMAILPIILATGAWGVAHWAFYPAQQTTLVGVAGVAAAPVALSLNASFMYLGFSLGAALGSLTLRYGSLGDLGFVSASCAAAALALAYAADHRAILQPHHPH